MNKPQISSYVFPKIQTIKSSSIRMAPYWVGAAITAVFSIVYAKVFGWSEEVCFSWMKFNPLLAFLITPLAMLASTCMAYFISPYANGSGIPQLLTAVEISRTPSPLLERLLELKMIAVKFLGSCVCVAGGGVTGREGPMLQISAGIFHWIQKVWPKSDSKTNVQSMILAGGAAGLASAFNTPLGGVIFAIEELAKVHISHIRTSVFHSVIIAGLIAQAVLGNYLYLGKIQIEMGSFQQTLPLVLASIVIGILGACFGSATVKLLDWRASMNFIQKMSMTLVLGLLVATMAYFYGTNAAGGGRHVIVDILTHSTSAPFELGFIRGFGNLFTYAGGVIGGIFAPALSTGAALGSWFSDFSASANHQIWALAGMVAFLTGVTRTPFTSLILVLEMTDTHNVIIYLMLAAITAQSAAKLIDPMSFYEHMSHRILKAANMAHEVHHEKSETT